MKIRIYLLNFASISILFCSQAGAMRSRAVEHGAAAVGAGDLEISAQEAEDLQSARKLVRKLGELDRISREEEYTGQALAEADDIGTTLARLADSYILNPHAHDCSMASASSYGEEAEYPSRWNTIHLVADKHIHIIESTTNEKLKKIEALIDAATAERRSQPPGTSIDIDHLSSLVNRIYAAFPTGTFTTKPSVFLAKGRLINKLNALKPPPHYTEMDKYRDLRIAITSSFYPEFKRNPFSKEAESLLLQKARELQQLLNDNRTEIERLQRHYAAQPPRVQNGATFIKKIERIEGEPVQWVEEKIVQIKREAREKATEVVGSPLPRRETRQRFPIASIFSESIDLSRSAFH